MLIAASAEIKLPVGRNFGLETLKEFENNLIISVKIISKLLSSDWDRDWVVFQKEKIYFIINFNYQPATSKLPACESCHLAEISAV